LTCAATIDEIREPDIAAKLDQQGIAASGGTPADFGAYISAEIKRWTSIARVNKITLEQ
jgi:tripartite-type tricarboxylate transporter receptor subunit TctC